MNQDKIFYTIHKIKYDPPNFIYDESPDFIYNKIPKNYFTISPDDVILYNRKIPKIMLLIFYQAFVNFFKIYRKTRIITITDDNKISYNTFIHSILNEIYKSYIKLFDNKLLQLHETLPVDKSANFLPLKKAATSSSVMFSL
jgi:hypothetical protein